MLAFILRRILQSIAVMAVVVGIVKAEMGTALLTAGLTLAYFAFMVFVGRPVTR